ncbi:substrate-binding domain-containing protein [Flavobacterium sp. HBTb2-11-1]|uniref:hybrid sensor histidine kinase/response regulator transcription factor n=1 Tax=Flavobacterium sp. HBTb2-11-1 TaxID=2692212 RepID=UPI00136C35F0|nr:substrate-binding domain-containing protein [Flavobacterium sp. HBTb2-11-1]MXO04441.1 substrate-binding domain-containing protein [Flavobacterium sp. HBTb2-11-1]
MKNILVLLLFFACLSCNRDTAQNHRKKIGFSQCISGDQWRVAMDYSMKLEASLYPEVDLTIYNADRNSEKQIQQIQKMIDDGMDAIIISPLESNALTPIIEKAYQKNIPVILVDRKINTDQFTTYLGADNLEVGRLAAKYLISNSKERAKVVEVFADLDTSPGKERTQGFNEVIKRFPGVSVVGRLDGTKKGLPEKEFEMLLEKNPGINYVFAFNDNIANQAWKVARKRGLENRIKFIGVDGLNGPNGGIHLVKDGVLAASILYPTGGSEALRMALEILKGEKVPKYNKLTTIVIDSLNADIMINQFDKITQQQTDIELQQNTIKKQEIAFTTQYNLTRLLTFFLLVILSLAIYSVYSAVTILRKKKLLEDTNEKILSQRNEIETFANQLKISNEDKLNFFTGLSHEFKTPLTLIMNAIDSVTSDKSIIAETNKKDFYLIHNNSRRLLRLINQLLDYRKIEEKKFNFNPALTNVVSFSKEIFKEFAREATRRNINYTFKSSHEQIEAFIDRNLMDKVYFNLLSNAFKFTPDNGSIYVSIFKSTEDNSFKISIKDSGMGIPDNEIKEVFSSFYQGSNNYKNSSGIGLSLSKNFIDLHHGKIEVFSKNGTEFIITIKLGKDHLTENSIVSDESAFITNNDYDYLDIDIQRTEELKSDEEKHTILIIEDNVDLLDFITLKLEPNYNVIKCNGTKAIETAFDLIPDIIICDLNLPELSGFEICEILKKDTRTSHIPTIILTAQDDDNSFVKALQANADLFLTKPFNLKVLKESIKGLLFNREKIRYYYTNNLNKVEELGFGAQDRDFIKKINDLISENLDNSSFSVEELAENLNISRVQLYRKMKALLNVNISDYINNIRLEKAKELLKNTTLTISEIAYSCGFSTPNYFSTSFKNKYNLSPKEFRT